MRRHVSIAARRLLSGAASAPRPPPPRPDADAPLSPDATHFGFRTVREGEKEVLVGEVFHNVARSYDLMNDVMSAGVHRLWKDALVARLGPGINTRLIDVAGGTGDISFRFLDAVGAATLPAGAKASVTVADINSSMLGVGRDRAVQTGRMSDRINFVVANAESLPFADASFDAYTIAFGIRNCTHVDSVLREAHRVLVPGGRFLCLEFSRVASVPGLAQLYDAYSFGVIPLLGEVVANDRASYQYLVESIRRFPAQDDFARMIREAGFRGVSYENLTLGVAAIHTGFKL
eukprot:Unigene9659_Nuclearia_a/m.29515 Unigene9659_Nuclearia_a/g.29515  ORF Unigene9659_Nuclearia_a/g.29515 Unigene9659_Nuclearia_a/m.29515 type:complete len:290 (-) Unigene9659_Nuclearia_a:22-891(-)